MPLLLRRRVVPPRQVPPSDRPLGAVAGLPARHGLEAPRDSLAGEASARGASPSGGASSPTAAAAAARLQRGRVHGQRGRDVLLRAPLRRLPHGGVQRRRQADLPLLRLWRLCVHPVPAAAVEGIGDELAHGGRNWTFLRVASPVCVRGGSPSPLPWGSTRGYTHTRPVPRRPGDAACMHCMCVDVSGHSVLLLLSCELTS